MAKHKKREAQTRSVPSRLDPETSGRRGMVILLGGLLFLLVLGTYLPALRNDFINYDDDVFVTDNRQVRGGFTWRALAWAFRSTVGGNWHPLTWLSHILDCQLFGLQPWGHHLTSVVLHAVNALLVFLVFRKMTGAVWRSLLVAALFGLHPLHVESVAWVAERKDVLSTLFWLLTLWGYTRYVQKGRRQKVEGSQDNGDRRIACYVLRVTSSGFYWLTLLFFALGLMSKPMLVTLPFVLLLLDYWPLRRLKRSECEVPPSPRLRRTRRSSAVARAMADKAECGTEASPEKTGERRLMPAATTPEKPAATEINFWPLVVEKIPFLVLAAAASVATFLIQQSVGAVAPIAGLPLGFRLENALVAYCRYVGKLFWPVNLSIFYPHPGHWPAGQVILAGVFLFGFSVLVIALRRRLPYLPVGWFWFLGTLVPVIGLVQVGDQSMADRYTYIPYLGLFLILAWGAGDLARRGRSLTLPLATAAITASLFCLSLTWRQIGYWRNNEILFRHARDVVEGNYMADNNLATEMVRQGRSQEATALYQEGARARPGSWLIDNNLGVELARQGRYAEALTLYQSAIKLNPNYADARNNLGMELARAGQPDAAIVQFREAIKLKPDNAAAQNNLGIALQRQGQLDEAAIHAREALRLDPDFGDAHSNLGEILLQQGRVDEAIAELQISLKLKPNDSDTYTDLGMALARQNRWDDAISQFQTALKLNPDLAAARTNLTAALAKKARH